MRRVAVRAAAYALGLAGAIAAAGVGGAAAQPVSPLASAAPDAGGLTLDSVFAWVLRNHPMALAADAVAERGPAELQRARGWYDPTVRGSFDRKDYLGSEYFTYGQGGIAWQTPYAVKLEAGREWADGIFVNPERTVPDAGQAYLSVKVPLLQGLLRDKYRTDVEQGRVAVERYAAAAEVIRNELRYDAAVAYTEWAFAKTRSAAIAETRELLERYLRNTRELVALGEKPGVDTVEATVYLVDQAIAAQQAAVDVQLAAQELLALYFPLERRDEPDAAALVPTLPLFDRRVADNPVLAELRGQAAELELERRLKREYLKPTLDVGYSVLGDGFELAPRGEKVDDRNFLTRAYKAAAEFRYPILNRRARGDVELAEIKLAETAGKLEAKRQELVAKAEAYGNAVLVYEAQLPQAERLLEQSRRLLAAEQELFELGESTQFLLNQRAQSLQKAFLTRAKLLSARAKAVWGYRQAVAEW